MDVWSQDTPDEIGKYAILERIDVGGMAEVFLGVDEQNQLVAIKRILPEVALKDQLVSMFIDEWRITAKLKHPNIARIYDFGRADKLYYMAMEFINGVDLRLVKQQFKILRKEQDAHLPTLAAYIVAHVCAALDYAYSRMDDLGQPMRIVHRDVSPSNVLLSFAGEIKLIDFGVAKATQRVYKTTGKALKGKFAYMSPEQARGKEVDNRSDIFSVGILLYELLTGKNPFSGGDEFNTLERVASVQAPPPSALGVDVPPELNLCCQRALALDPEDRYGSAQTMGTVLRRYYEREGFDQDELKQWLKQRLPNQYEKSLLVSCQEERAPLPGDSHGPEAADTSGPRWDMLADREAPTTQRQASGELAQEPAPAPHSHRTSWLAIGLTAVAVLAGAFAVMHLMDDDDTPTAGATSAAGAPAKTAAGKAPRAPVKPRAVKQTAGVLPRPVLHTVTVINRLPGARCRAQLGDEKLVLKPAPCQIKVPSGTKIELRVEAGGHTPFTETWTVATDRRLEVRLLRLAPTKLPARRPVPSKIPLPAPAKLPPPVDPGLPSSDQSKPNPVTDGDPRPAPRVKVIRALGPEPEAKKPAPEGKPRTITPPPGPQPAAHRPGSKTKQPTPAARPGPVAKPAPVARPRPAAKPKPAAKPGPVAKPKPVAKPRMVAKPKPKPAKKKPSLEDGAADWD